MTDLPTGQPAEGAKTPAPDRGIVSGITTTAFAIRDVILSIAPYCLVVYAIDDAIKLNDASFTKGLVEGLFAAALLAINPKGGKAGQ